MAKCTEQRTLMGNTWWVATPWALCDIFHISGGGEHPPHFTVLGLTGCEAELHNRHFAIEAGSSRILYPF